MPTHHDRFVRLVDRVLTLEVDPPEDSGWSIINSQLVDIWFCPSAPVSTSPAAGTSCFNRTCLAGRSPCPRGTRQHRGQASVPWWCSWSRSAQRCGTVRDPAGFMVLERLLVIGCCSLVVGYGCWLWLLVMVVGCGGWWLLIKYHNKTSLF